MTMTDVPEVKGQKWGGEALRFGIVFAVCLAVFGTIYIFLRHSSIFVPFLEFNARAANSLLNLFGTDTRVDGVFVNGPSFSFWVSAECTSTIFTAIFASAAIGWPSTVKEKLTGIVLAAAVLFVVNLVRIVTLYYIGSAFPGFLDFAHFFLWQILLILLTVGLWVLWMEKIVHKTEKGQDIK